MAVFNPLSNSAFANETNNRGLRPAINTPSTPEPLKQTANTPNEVQRGLRRGVAMLKEAAHGVAASAGALTGQEQFAEEQLAAAKEQQQVMQQNAAQVQSIDQIGQNGDYVGDTVKYLESLTGEQLPIMATMAAGGVVTRSAAKTMKAGKAATEMATTAGVAVPSVGIEAGSLMSDLGNDETARKEHSLSEIAAGTALGGTVAGALDALPAVGVASKFGLGKAMRNEMRKSLGSVAKAAAREGAQGMASEGLQEAAQTAIERTTASFLDSHRQVLGEEGIKEILNAAAAGAIMGGPTNALSGALEEATRPRTAFDDQFDDIEADDELNATYAKHQFNALKDVPELQGQLEGLQDFDFPDVQDQLSTLGVQYMRNVGRPEIETQRILKSYIKPEFRGRGLEKKYAMDLLTGKQDSEHAQYFDQTRGDRLLANDLSTVKSDFLKSYNATTDALQEIEDDGKSVGQLVDETNFFGRHDPQTLDYDRIGKGSDEEPTGLTERANFDEPQFEGAFHSVNKMGERISRTKGVLDKLKDERPNELHEEVSLEERIRDKAKRTGESYDELAGAATSSLLERMRQDPAKADYVAKYEQDPKALLKDFTTIRSTRLSDTVSGRDELGLSREALFKGSERTKPIARRMAPSDSIDPNGAEMVIGFKNSNGNTEPHSINMPRLVSRMLEGERQQTGEAPGRGLTAVARAVSGGLAEMMNQGAEIAPIAKEIEARAMANGDEKTLAVLEQARTEKDKSKRRELLSSVADRNNPYEFLPRNTVVTFDPSGRAVTLEEAMSTGVDRLKVRVNQSKRYLKEGTAQLNALKTARDVEQSPKIRTALEKRIAAIEKRVAATEGQMPQAKQDLDAAFKVMKRLKAIKESGVDDKETKKERARLIQQLNVLTGTERRKTPSEFERNPNEYDPNDKEVGLLEPTLAEKIDAEAADVRARQASTSTVSPSKQDNKPSQPVRNDDKGKVQPGIRMQAEPVAATESAQPREAIDDLIRALTQPSGYKTKVTRTYTAEQLRRNASKAERARLSAVIDRLAKTAAQKATLFDAVKKTLGFAKSKTTVNEKPVLESKLDTSEEQSVVEQWAKQLNLGFVPTVIASKRDFERVIRAVPELEDQDFIGANLSGHRTIVLNPSMTDRALRMETLAHEFGHLLFENEFLPALAAGDTTSIAIVLDFLDWRAKQSFTAGPMAARRTKMNQRILAYMEIANSLSDDSDVTFNQMLYALDFNEWFADHISRALTPNSKPVTLTEKFFAKVAEKFKNFVGMFAPNRNVAKFVQEVFDRNNGRMASEIKSKNAKDAAQRFKEMLTALAAENKDGLKGVLQTEEGEILSYVMKVAATAAGHKWEGLGTNAHAVQFMKVNDAMRGMAESTEGWEAYVSNVNTLVRTMSEADRNALHAMATAPHVINQLSKLLNRNARHMTPGSRIAYAFVLWEAGVLDVGPRTQSTFEKIVAMVTKHLGVMRKHELGINIMHAMKGSLAGGKYDPVREAVADTKIKKATKVVRKAWSHLDPAFDAVFSTAGGRMRATGNPHLIKIAQAFHVNPDEQGVSTGYFASKTAMVGRFMSKLAARIEAIGDNDALRKDVLSKLQTGEAADTNSETDKMVRAFRDLYKEMREYAVRAGVDVGNIEDYFPHVYNQEAVTAKRDDLIKMLSDRKFDEPLKEMARKWVLDRAIDELDRSDKKVFAKAVEDLSKMTYDELAEYHKEAKLTRRQIAELLVKGIQTSEEGMLENADPRSAENTFSPYMSAVNHRTLHFVQKLGDAADKKLLASVMVDSLEGVTAGYIQQVVKKAEYTRRFGERSSTLRQMFEDAREWGASKQDMELAQNFVNAMVGKHGRATGKWFEKYFGLELGKGEIINPTLQKGMSSLLILRNFSVLALASFTSLADPVGIYVRGGDLDTAWRALRAGIDEIRTIAKGDRSERRKLAEALGTIETRAGMEALNEYYGAGYLNSGLKKWNEKFFEWNMLNSLTRGTRLIALDAAVGFLEKHAVRAGDLSDRYLEQLGLKRSDVKISLGKLKILTAAERDALMEKQYSDNREEIKKARAELARDQRVRDALNRWVDEAILRPNAAQRPVWGSDPHFMLVFHLKQFMYSFHNQILKRVFHELGEDNWGPLFALFSFVPAMMGIMLLRSALGLGSNGQDSWGFGDYLWNAIQRSGIAGLGQILIDAGKDVSYGGQVYDSFAGPTYETVTKIDDLLLNQDSGRLDAIVDNLPAQNVWRQWFGL